MNQASTTVGADCDRERGPGESHGRRPAERQRREVARRPPLPRHPARLRALERRLLDVPLGYVRIRGLGSAKLAINFCKIL